MDPHNAVWDVGGQIVAVAPADLDKPVAGDRDADRADGREATGRASARKAPELLQAQNTILVERDNAWLKGPLAVARIFRHEKNDRLRVCRIDGCRGGSCKP